MAKFGSTRPLVQRLLHESSQTFWGGGKGLLLDTSRGGHRNVREWLSDSSKQEVHRREASPTEVGQKPANEDGDGSDDNKRDSSKRLWGSDGVYGTRRLPTKFFQITTGYITDTVVSGDFIISKL